MTRRPHLFALLDDACERLARLGQEGCERAWAAGVPCFYGEPGVEGNVRHDPDGRRWEYRGGQVVRELGPLDEAC